MEIKSYQATKSLFKEMLMEYRLIKNGLKYFCIGTLAIVILSSSILYVQKEQINSNFQSDINKFNSVDRSEYFKFEKKNFPIKMMNMTDMTSLTTFSGTATKKFTLTDQIIQFPFNILPKKSIEIEVTIHFQTGINLDVLTNLDLTVEEDEVYVQLPTIELITFEVPYDQMIIQQSIGLLQDQYDDETKKHLYKEIVQLAKQEILSDKLIRQKTLNSTIDKIEKFFITFFGYKKVHFMYSFEC